MEKELAYYPKYKNRFEAIALEAIEKYKILRARK